MQQLFKDQTTIHVESYPAKIDVEFRRAAVRIQTPSTPMPDEDNYDSASVEALNRIIAATASAGTHLLTFTAAPTDLVVGHQYVVSTTDQEPNFVVKVSRVISSTQVQLQDPLPQEVPASSRIKGFRFSKELTAEQVKNEGQCIARWRGEDGDRNYYYWDEPFLIVRVATNYHLTSDKLERLYPLVLRLRPEDQTLAEIIEASWENYLRPDLESKGIRPNQIKSWERLDPAHAAACVYHLVVTDERQDPGFVEQWRTMYAHQLDLLFASVFFWYDDNDSETPGISDHDFRQREIFR
ncbi:MAG TPA: hypothetical protein DCW74_01030 [Alteromonas australica]|uniref:Uncharacterized protein n=1 Tax=Alteromonas australica TaxID=589873 RepID=A0A350NZ35_9ALTE|nr:hypothetical protein [Alteromonas australica]|tara:strand:- start:798 stop:1685 length:888 start_codon:yes stop_codon:yes gene_type:complete